MSDYNSNVPLIFFLHLQEKIELTGLTKEASLMSLQWWADAPWRN